MNQEAFFSRYKYDIEKDELGGGGFGTVYKAFDEVRNRHVALKVSQVKKGQESLSLLKEVELAAELPEHKNIAHYEVCYRLKMPNGIFDFGILQYYPDGNLTQLIQSETLSQVEKEKIAQGIIEGIDHLHRHNIVHRDLKSSNILMTRGYQGNLVPKIADFGLSKLFAENDKSYFSNSIAGGSLLYVAPEQLAGEEIRKNVDLWSLGVVLYELFVGTTPFTPELNTGPETARAEIVKKINRADIPEDINHVPQPWQQVIKACLIVDPKQRVKTIKDIHDIIGGKLLRLNLERPTKKIIQSNKEGTKVVGRDNYKPFPSPSSHVRNYWWLLPIIILAGVGVYFLLQGIAEGKAQKNKDLSPSAKTLMDIESGMVHIPGGSCLIGSTPDQGKVFDDDEPVRQISVRTFYISKYEVTQEQWEVIMGSNPSYHRGCALCPVEQVSNNDIQEFIQKLNRLSGKRYRLPTEEEWEYAARAGGRDGTKYAGSNNLDNVGWYKDNSSNKTHPVGLLFPNGYGLYDMSGNVGEQTSSDYDSISKVMRGGIWFAYTIQCRVAERFSGGPPSNGNGFRLSRT